MLRYSPRIRQNRSLMHPCDLGQDTISVHDFPGSRRVMHSEVSWQMEFHILYCNRDNPILLSFLMPQPIIPKPLEISILISKPIVISFKCRLF